MASVEQRDFQVSTVDGVSIAVSEVRPSRRVAGRAPIILLRDAPVADARGQPPRADNDVLAGKLARAGHVCFVVDARGFGTSDRTAATVQPPRESMPLVRAIEIARDLDAAANELRRVSGTSKISIIQRGIPVGIVYAALWPEKVSHLVLCDAWLDRESGGERAAMASDCLPLPQQESDDDDSGTPADEPGMNYASHIYCRVMIVDSGSGVCASEPDISGLADNLVNAREIRVWRPAQAGRMSRRRSRRCRGETVKRVADFLR